MAMTIRDQYLAAARDLEHADLLAINIGASQEELGQNVQKFENLNSILYSKAFHSVSGSEREEIKKVNARVTALFVPVDNRWYPFLKKRKVHYLRIALENQYWRLAHQCFMKMPHEKKTQAFELLCRTHGNLGKDTVEGGIHHVAYNPEYLLNPVPDLPNTPRIIDVLLADD